MKRHTFFSQWRRARASLLSIVALMLATSSAQVFPQSQQEPQQERWQDLYLSVDLSQSIEAIVIEGADASIEPLILIRLNAREGTPINQIDVSEERNNILNLGKFSEVSVQIEDRGSGPILLIRVEQNPSIAKVVILDDAFPQESILAILEQQNLLTPGAIYDTRRAQDAQETLQKIYRDNGYPFDVNVVLEPVIEADGVTLNYAIEGRRIIREIRFGDSQVFDAAELQEAFSYPQAGLGQDFDYLEYQQAVVALAKAYENAGYRGSGVDVEQTSLEDGVLKLALRELVIVGVDTLEVGVSPEELSLGLGDLFNYDILLNDIERLARAGNQDIRLEYPSTPEGEVRVILRAGTPDSSGVISDVRIQGSSVFSEEELQAQLRLREGSPFSSELANEDYRRLRAFYEENGYALVGEPNYNYDDEGRYIQTLREVRISEYSIEVEEGEQRTRSDVILRYLPEVGTAFNRDKIRDGLFSVAGIGAVEPVDFSLDFPDDEIPSNAIANIRVRESRSRIFSPSLTYAPDSGLNAEISYTDNNFFGLGHKFQLGLAGVTSDIGLRLGGNLSYSIPWLYLDFLDFKRVPTSLSFSAFSNTAGNQVLTTPTGQSTILHPDALGDREGNRVRIGEYSRRDTGASFSFGRPLADDLRLQVGVRGSYSSYQPEPNNNPCDVAGGVVVDNDCELPSEFSLDYMPPDGFNTFISSTLTYDNRDQPAFPTQGVRAFAGAGFGFGSDYISPRTNAQARYNYQQLTGGFRTYLSPASNQVFAFRLDAGHQFGGDYPNNRYFTVGNTMDENTIIRGFTRSDIDGSQTYAIGSIEYRYDFGLATAVTQTLIAIAFADVGYASGFTNVEDYSLSFPLSAGIGLQINIGSAAGILAPIRLDYGFSERHPTGVLSFRLGYAF